MYSLSSLQDTREPSRFSESGKVVLAVFCVAETGLANYKTQLIPFVTLFSGHRVAQLCKVVI